MAAIDKTYVSSYEEWKEIIDYARKTVFTCPNGIKIKLINYCYDYYTEKEVKEWLDRAKEIPVMNTPCAVDYFLIKYCPIDMIQNTMKSVYSEEDYNAIKNGTSKYDTFVRPQSGKHFKFIKKPRYHKPLKWFNKYYKAYIQPSYSVDVSYPESYGYNEKYDTWVLKDELGVITCSGADVYCKSLKALCRKIMKWNLPVGIEVHFSGRYEGEEGRLVITK